MNPNLGMVLSGLITMIISVPGGLRTVVYTDFIQAAILLCGFGLLTRFALADVGGMTGLREAVPPACFTFMDTLPTGVGWS
jgi:SSS family solute:Na+ symporter